MLLSIIIPVYNAAATLNRCIESILAQQEQDYEILLIDDGSKDDSDEICDRWAEKDTRIRVFHQANAGVSTARNVGLDHAEGRWVCFIDADDSIQGAYLPTSLDDNIDMYVQNELINDIDQYRKMRVPEGGEILSCHEFLRKYAHTNLFRGVCAKFCRMDIIRREGIRFDPRHRFGEDALLFLNYIRFCKNVQLLEGGYYVYITDSDWIQKYRYSREEAYLFFQDFAAVYRQLPVKPPRLAQYTYDIYEQVANKNEAPPLSWKLHPSVLAVKRLQIPGRSWKYRLRCELARVLSWFYFPKNSS